jgi:hypothetical protein
MNWKLFTRSSRSHKNKRPSQRVKFRPKLDALEDRTLLTVYSFVVDPTQSALTLSGSINGSPIQEQGPGSLVTTYEGVIDADVADDLSTIQFLNDGAAATADISGAWRPRRGGSAGSDDANYGGHVHTTFFGIGVDADAAVRDLVAAGASDPLPVSPNDGTFPATLSLSIAAGSADYRYDAGIFGSMGGNTSVAGQSADNQTSDSGVLSPGDPCALAASIPISITLRTTVSTPLGDIPVVLNIDGSIVGCGNVAGGGATRSRPPAEKAAAVAQTFGTHAGLSSDPSVLSDLGFVGPQAPVQTQDGAAAETSAASPARSESTGGPSQVTGSAHRADQLAAIDTLVIDMIGNDGVSF